MKKLLAIILILCVAIFQGCGGECMVIPIDAETNLEFWIAQEVTREDMANCTYLPGWMGAAEYLGSSYTAEQDADGNPIAPEVSVTYLVTNYPDYSSKKQAVTTIVISDPNVSVYGLSIGDSEQKINDVMTQIGYKKLDGNLRYSLDGITFSFNDKIVISAKVTNKYGIQF